MHAGRVPVFLLDSDVPENGRVARWITARLYDSDARTRLAQYVLLGAGGAAALRALEIEPGVVHMNEGHAAFAAIEFARDAMRDGADFEEAFATIRKRTVFTTHTPVPAGNDTYPAEDVRAALGPLVDVRRDGSRDDHPARSHAPRRRARAVRRHAVRAAREPLGERRQPAPRRGVARDVARAVARARGRRRADRPCHERRPRPVLGRGADAPPARPPARRRLVLARRRRRRRSRASTRSPPRELWAARCEQRRLLVEYVRDRSQLQRIARGEPRDYVEAAAKAFDENVLTIGFARRLATYKRLNVLLHDVARSFRMLRGDRPVQLLLAGKAHPRDDDGKRLVQQLFAVRSQDRAFERVVFLEDYNLNVAARLVRGCDLWINVPRPPLEASGTSGMKVAVNGGLQLSVLDGWWAEGYDGENGWALDGDIDHDHAAQDHRHAQELYRLLEEAIVPEFYDRDDAGVPQAWMQRVKRSMRTLIPAFSATRMVRDYEERIYRTP